MILIFNFFFIFLSELKVGGRLWVGEKRNGVVGLFDFKYINEVVGKLMIFDSFYVICMLLLLC